MLWERSTYEGGVRGMHEKCTLGGKSAAGLMNVIAMSNNNNRTSYINWSKYKPEPNQESNSYYEYSQQLLVSQIATQSQTTDSSFSSSSFKI